MKMSTVTFHQHSIIGSSMSGHQFPEKIASFGANKKQQRGLRVKMGTRSSEQSRHWEACHSLLSMVSRHHGFGLGPAPLHLVVPPRLEQPVIILILVLQVLDNYEDDMSIGDDIKIPFLKALHRYIYNPDLKIPSGTKDLQDLVDQFHHVQTAFLDLDKSYQEVIKETTKNMGVGFAKFLNKEINTVENYNEYAYCAGVLPLHGFSKLNYVSGLDELAPDDLIASMGLFAQKADVIQDYFEDINDTPKPRLLWPRQVWGKYVTKLEDFKHEENSVEALQCLNEMITDALMHVEGCLKFMSTIRDPFAFRAFALSQVRAIRMLALCYNNNKVFSGSVKLESSVTLRMVGQTRTMSDVYAAFFKYSTLIKSKAEKHGDDATETLSRLEAILKICRDCGTKQ